MVAEGALSLILVDGRGEKIRNNKVVYDRFLCCPSSLEIFNTAIPHFLTKALRCPFDLQLVFS